MLLPVIVRNGYSLMLGGVIETASMRVREIDASLCKKGFERNDKSDHIRYILYVDGLKTGIMTKISHGENEIGDGLITAMSRQLKLSKNQFQDLVKCPLSKEAYKQILQDAKAIDLNKR